MASPQSRAKNQAADGRRSLLHVRRYGRHFETGKAADNWSEGVGHFDSIAAELVDERLHLAEPEAPNEHRLETEPAVVKVNCKIETLSSRTGRPELDGHAA